MGATHSTIGPSSNINTSSISSSGTLSTAYTSTTRSSLPSTTRSIGFMSTGPIEEAMEHVVEVEEVNIEKEKHFDDLVQEFFGAPSANRSIDSGTIGVLKRWFRELGIRGCLDLAGGASARGDDLVLVHAFPSEQRVNAVWRWIRALTEITETSHSARLLFPDRCSQHARFTQETIVNMLPFVDLIVATSDEALFGESPYKKLDTLLDVRDALSKASSKIRLPSQLTPCSEVERIQNEMVSLLSAKEGKVDEAIWNTMAEINRGILEPLECGVNSPGADTPRVSPTIYKVTRSAVDYILYLRSKYSSVAPILYEAASLGKIVYEVDSTNPLSTLALEMFSCIEEKLSEMAQPLPDQGFRLLFLINNLHLIQQLLHHSISELVPESHTQTLTNKIEGCIRDYLEASWAPVLSCLCRTTPLSFGRDSQPFTKFEKEFKKTYSTQKLWPVRNPEPRKKLRKAITEKVVSGLTQYLVDNNNITTWRVALLPLQEMQEKLQEIFEG